MNVSAIRKDKLFKGEKGTYLDVTLIELHGDKYGNDYMAVQDLGKEARERGEKGPILGNAKLYARRESAPKNPAPSEQTRPAQNENLDEDVPF